MELSSRCFSYRAGQAPVAHQSLQIRHRGIGVEILHYFIYHSVFVPYFHCFLQRGPSGSVPPGSVNELFASLCEEKTKTDSRHGCSQFGKREEPHEKKRNGHGWRWFHWKSFM